MRKLSLTKETLRTLNPAVASAVLAGDGQKSGGDFRPSAFKGNCGLIPVPFPSQAECESIQVCGFYSEDPSCACTLL